MKTKTPKINKSPANQENVGKLVQKGFLIYVLTGLATFLMVILIGVAYHFLLFKPELEKALERQERVSQQIEQQKNLNDINKFKKVIEKQQKLLDRTINQEQLKFFEDYNQVKKDAENLLQETPEQTPKNINPYL